MPRIIPNKYDLVKIGIFAFILIFVFYCGRYVESYNSKVILCHSWMDSAFQKVGIYYNASEGGFSIVNYTSQNNGVWFPNYTVIC